MTAKFVTVMGSYVTDLAFRTEKLPAWGETYMGKEFRLGSWSSASEKRARPIAIAKGFASPRPAPEPE